jgi:hypothetical protein
MSKSDLGGLTRISDLALEANMTLETILDDSDLFPALQHQCGSVIGFLTRFSNLQRLIDLSLTLTLSCEPDYSKYCRLAVSALCSDSSDLAREVMDSGLLSPAVANFFDSPALESLPCCANLQRLVCKYQRFSSGAFIDSVPALIPNLCDHLDVVAFRHLVFQLFTDFRDGFFWMEAGERLPSVISTGRPAGWGAVLVVRELLFAQQRPLRSGVDISAVFRALLEFAFGDSPPLARADAFELIAEIPALFPGSDFAAVLEEYAPKADPAAEGIVGAAIARAFPSLFASAVDRFLANPSDAFLGNAVVRRFRAMPDGERARAVAEGRLVERVIAAVEGAAAASGHIIALATAIGEAGAVETNPAWAAFAEGPLRARTEFAASCRGYGGRVAGSRAPGRADT